MKPTIIFKIQTEVSMVGSQGESSGLISQDAKIMGRKTRRINYSNQVTLKKGGRDYKAE